MGRGASLAVLLLAAWLAVAGCAFGSAAECGRSVGWDRVEQKRVAPGETFRLHGKGFAGDCYDGNQLGRPPPERDIPIGLRQGEKSWRLATVDAGPAPDYVLDAELTVPEDARPGRAVVEIHTELSERPYKVPFRVIAGGGLPETGDGA